MASSSRIPDEYLNTWGAINNYAPNAFQGTSISRDANSRPVKKLNSACDLCRQSRVKCSGGFSCRRCEDNNLKCKYSISRRCGRVKAALGSRQHKLRSPRLPPRNGTSQDMGIQIAPLCEALNVPSNLDIISQDGPSLALDFAGDFNEYGFSFPDDQFGFEGMDWPMNGIVSNGFSHPFSNRVSSTKGSLPVFPPHSFSSEVTHLNSDIEQRHLSTNSGLITEIIPTTSNEAPTLLFNNQSQSRSQLGQKCQCFTDHIICMAELCTMQEDPQSSNFDAILRIVRERSKQISAYFGCNKCSKEIIKFMFPALTLQHLVNLLCNMTKEGEAYLKRGRLNVCSFELSEEEDLAHKTLLVTSSVQHIVLLLEEFDDCIKFHRQEQLTSNPTESEKSNLIWVVGTIQNLKFQLGRIGDLLKSRN